MPIYFVFALALLNTTAVFAARVVLSLYALSLGAQPATIGLLAASYSLFPTLLAVAAGRLTDRVGARWLLTFGAAGSGVGMLVPYFVQGLPAVFIAGSMSGLSLVFYNVSTQNLVGLLSHPDDRAKNFSNYALCQSAANFMAPLIAGFSIDHFDHATACLHLAVLTVVPIAMLLYRGNVLPGSQHVEEKQSGGGIRTLLADRNVRRTLATGSLLNTGQNLYQFYLPVYAHSIGLSASIIGVVLAMNSAAAFVVRALLPRLVKRFGEESVLAYVFFMGAVSLALMPFFENAIVLGMISFIFGLGMGCGQPIVIMLMFSSSSQGRSGETLGLKIGVNQLTKLVAPVIFGVIATALGIAPIFWLNALMLAGGGHLSRPQKINSRR